jgi:hypothetical protein
MAGDCLLTIDCGSGSGRIGPSKLLLTSANTVILGFGACWDPWPYFCSFQALCMFWNGASSLTEKRGCTFCDYSEQCGNSVAGKFLLALASFNHHIWYRPHTASIISTVIVFIAVGTCLLSCQLEMDIISGSTIPILRHHVTLHPS